MAAVAKAKCDGIRLLRTYWYDAPLGGGLMSASHSALAMADNVKLRLGARNGQGQQKGVDSLIVTDLIELARNGSICDAILLSGDEDVRIGVQIAQSFGVCVHLLGIHPARGSQSPALRQEADTKTEWDKDLVSKFLTVTAPLATAPPARSSTSSTTAKPKPAAKPAGKADTTDTAKVQAVVLEMIAAMDTTDLVGLEKYWSAGNRGLPPDVDRPLLGKCRDALSRELSPDERRETRAVFASKVRAALGADSGKRGLSRRPPSPPLISSARHYQLIIP